MFCQNARKRGAVGRGVMKICAALQKMERFGVISWLHRFRRWLVPSRWSNRRDRKSRQVKRS